MPLSGCSGGLLLTAVVALLLLPAQYYVPDLYSADEQLVPPPSEPPPQSVAAWFDLAFSHLPPLDLFFTLSLLILAFFTYICEWIQRKLMERRIVKVLNALIVEPVPGGERGAAARVGRAAGAAGGDAADGGQRHVRVQPAAVPGAAPAPLPRRQWTTLQLLL
ncbi:uncharacterized protein LOC114361768 isoform X2 [Ostrinia furnacalis]|uniref:uncharacterized protein LOC114361768 isoform X2 n=1 Tax=Ostrinia furnacalis TaxID=93504 RepID=UPI001038C6A9|nr:uncharacterized protein LOC114361768 isoform X2 [Ostrinia furnacalis]